MLNLSEPYKGWPVWALAFRPFFLAGTIFGCAAIMWWGLFLLGVAVAPGSKVGAIQWHGHEMLFGFGMAIVYGFALTAVQTWTGIPGVSGMRLVVLWSAWLIARIAWLVPSDTAFWLAMVSDMTFLALGLIFFLRPVVARKQWSNIWFAGIPLLILTVNGVYYWAAITGNYAQQQHSLQAVIWLFGLIISVMGGRVIPFFIARKLNRDQRLQSRWLGVGCHAGLLALAIDTLSWGWFNDLTMILVAFLVGIFHLIRLLGWWMRGIERIPLLWSLYFAYMFIPLFIIAWGVAGPLGLLRSDVLHLLSVGAISGVILAMIARVSLGHTGRELESRATITTAFVLIIVAAVLRFCPVFHPSWRLELQLLSAIAWAGSFFIFILCYWRILIGKRVDGRPG